MTIDMSNCGGVDTYLSTGEFGCSTYLATNCKKLYQHIALIVSHHSYTDIPNPAGCSLLSHRAIVRRELDYSFAELAEGKAITNVHRLSQLSHLDNRIEGLQHHKVGPLTFLSDWRNDPMAEKIRDAFCKSMLDEGSQIRGVRPLVKHIDIAKKTLNAMKKLLPKTFFGTLELAPGIVIIRGQVSSGYINENPHCFFINDTQFADVPLLAETLLHEALHEKMACIRLTSNLLTAGYDDLASEQKGDILVPWPNISSPRYWSFARALAAYHVYVHTSALYHLLLRDRDTLELCSEGTLISRLKVQFARARYLHAALQCENCAAFVDVDAKKFLTWMGDVLDSIFIAAPIPGFEIQELPSWCPNELRRMEDAQLVTA